MKLGDNGTTTLNAAARSTLVFEQPTGQHPYRLDQFAWDLRGENQILEEIGWL